MSKANIGGIGIRTTALEVRQRARIQLASERLERPSLNRPSRPITPRSQQRRMFEAQGGHDEYLPHKRPNTAFKVDADTFDTGFKRVGSVPDHSMRQSRGLLGTNPSGSTLQRASSSHSAKTSSNATNAPRTPPSDWDWANSDKGRVDGGGGGRADILNLEGAATMVVSSRTAKGSTSSRSKPRRQRKSGGGRTAGDASRSTSGSSHPSAGSTDLDDSVTLLWEDLLSSLKSKLKQLRAMAHDAPVSLVNSSTTQSRQAQPSTPGAAAAALATAAKVIATAAAEVQILSDKIFAMSEDVAPSRKRSTTAAAGPAADVDRVHKVRLKLVEILGPLMVSSDAMVLLRVSRTLLRVCVNALRLERFRHFEGTLLSTVKVLYKLGKEDEHDQLFLVEGVLGSLMEVLSLSVCGNVDVGASGAACQLSSSLGSSATGSHAGWRVDKEVLLYATSTVKFLSGNSKNQTWLAAQGRAVQILAPMCDVRVKGAARGAGLTSVAASGRGSRPAKIPLTEDDVAQVLVQISEVLRNLSRMKYAKQFYENRVVERLCGLIPSYKSHQKLMYNVSRILGKFSLDSKCRGIINGNRVGNARHFLGLCEQYPDHNGMLVRLFFTLGNLTASNDDNRRLIALQLGGIHKLSHLLHAKTQAFVALVQLQRAQEEQLLADTTGAADDEAQNVSDVLVKLIRVLANLAIHSEVGPLILADAVIVRDTAVVVEHCTSGGWDEELLLNAVATLTNLSFYENWGTNTASQVQYRGPIFQTRLSLLQTLLPLATHENDEVVAHALRVVGNLSRDAEVRTLAVTLKGLELLALLLDKTDPEIVATACGILVNFSSDVDLVEQFLARRMVLVCKLVQVMGEAVEANEPVCDQIAMNAMKTLVNLVGHGVRLDARERRRLHEKLDPYFSIEAQAELVTDDNADEDPELVHIAQALLSSVAWDAANHSEEADEDGEDEQLLRSVAEHADGGSSTAPAATAETVMEPL